MGRGIAVHNTPTESLLVNREVTQHQQAADGTAFPKTKRDYALSARSEAIHWITKQQTENKAAGKSHDFSRMNQDSEKIRLSQKLKAVHKGRTLRQIDASATSFFVDTRLFHSHPSLTLAWHERWNAMSAAKAATSRISLANTPEQIGRCSAVMRELRPHIKAIDFACARPTSTKRRVTACLS
jgi:hypothetical protein